MRHNLLDFLLCPDCGGPLTCSSFEIKTVDPDFGHFCRTWCAAKAISIDGPPPLKIEAAFPGEGIPFHKKSEIDREDCRICHKADVTEGILACLNCRNIFPIIDTIPEILPDELRNSGRENAFYAKYRDRLEHQFPDLFRAGPRSEGPSSAAGEIDWTYKIAEMKLTHRTDLPFGFFGPGYVVPFEPLHPVRSIEKILRFMISVHHVNLRLGDFVLDLGVGYAWTTEWLKRLGYNVIGVDLNREYLHVGLERTHYKLPPLLLSDIEDLPLRHESFHGIVFFDAFHHLANREKCLQNLAELLVPGGLLIMAEPGERHASHPGSVHVMQTYGILEKGITEKELRRMIKNTSFEDVTKYPYDFGEVEILLLKKKGKRVFTSKGPDFLNAQIVPDIHDIAVKPGQALPFSLSVQNTGNTLWLHKTNDGIGEVRVGFKLLTSDRVLIDENYRRVPLPKDIAPRDSVRITTELPPIQAPGDYILEIDCVSEGIIWFKDISYNSVFVALKVRE